MNENFRNEGVGNHRLLEEDRSIWKYVLFGIFFLPEISADVETACGLVEESGADESKKYWPQVLLTIVTLGVYSLYWYYCQGERIRRAGEKYGLFIEEKGSTYLLWAFPGILLFLAGPFVARYLLVYNVQKLSRVYNYRILHSQEQESRRGRLLCIAGTYCNVKLDMEQGMSIRMGRNRNLCNLVFPNSDEDVSRNHCLIRFEDGYYYVTDYSSQGTYLNSSQRLVREKETKCSPGSRLSLGGGRNVFILQ